MVNKMFMHLISLQETLGLFCPRLYVYDKYLCDNCMAFVSLVCYLSPAVLMVIIMVVIG